ncbi:hypothetical protein Zmor_025768 [Zophobas morio]|uniref:Uncharacterized protein n=1 Tax=Zophobas morio TaxID=2755281 RepID=A0AA38HSH9_9CUCU|nr:hypothetical protein Zmor_025768 [Zophobas morio]
MSRTTPLHVLITIYRVYDECGVVGSRLLSPLIRLVTADGSMVGFWRLRNGQPTGNWKSRIVGRKCEIRISLMSFIGEFWASELGPGWAGGDLRRP